MLMFEKFSMESSIFSMKDVSGGHSPTIFLLGLPYPITFANGKERAFGNSYSKPYALGFGKNKDEMESPVQESLILSR
jgi:hypothetical protein